MPLSSIKLRSYVPQVSPELLCIDLKRRLGLEKIDRYYEYGIAKYKGRMRLSAAETIFIRFPTLKKQFPDMYRGESYNLLVVLRVISQDGVGEEFFLELDRIRSSTNYDSIVFICSETLRSATISRLKRDSCYIIKIEASEISSISKIDNFFYIEGVSFEDGIYFNLYAEYVLRRLKKLFHMILSEIAAPIYNQEYGKGSPATQSVMAYEEGMLMAIATRLQNDLGRRSGLNIVDVGCGTGRHSFLLREMASDIIAFDISPAMIEQANRTKRSLEDTTVRFSVLDFEYESLEGEHRLNGSVDIVIASFGMGSFVEDTDRMLRRFYQWLRPGGCLFISFYNKKALLNIFEPLWRETSLSANMNVENETLKVRLPGGSVFYIYCRPFDEILEAKFEGKFRILEKHSFPTAMSVMPPASLASRQVFEVYEHMDKMIAANEATSFGHYMMIIAERVGGDSIGITIQDYLTGAGVQFDRLYHHRALTIDEVSLELGQDRGALVKAVVLEIGERHSDHKKLIILALAGDKRISLKALASLFGVSRAQINFADRETIFRLGFPLGGVSPIPVQGSEAKYFLDESIYDMKAEWIFCGAGENNSSLRFAKSAVPIVFANARRVSLTVE